MGLTSAVGNDAGIYPIVGQIPGNKYVIFTNASVYQDWINEIIE